MEENTIRENYITFHFQHQRGSMAMQFKIDDHTELEYARRTIENYLYGFQRQMTQGIESTQAVEVSNSQKGKR